MAVKRKRKPSARGSSRKKGGGNWFAANRRWLSYAGAAAVAALVIGGGYWLSVSGEKHAPVVAAKPAPVAVAPIRPPLPMAAPGQAPPLPTAAPGMPAQGTPASVPPLPNAAPGQAATAAMGQGVPVQPGQIAVAQPVAVQTPASQAPASQPAAVQAGSATYQDSDRQKLADLARTAEETGRRPRELASLPPPMAAVVPPKQPPAPPPPHRRTALPLAPGERPMVAMVFDDLGVVRSRTKRVIDLPGPLTLSFLPYSQDLASQTADGRRHGHEVMLHMPMQPLGKADPGQNALTVDLAAPDIRRRLDWALDRIGAVGGLNNHMGSRFTADAAGMAVVMQDLRARQMYFLDSMTSGRSVGVQTARQAGIPVVARDVFLDDKISRENAAKWLATLETVAHRQGYGIAIGHPHDETVDVVGPWLRTLEGKGLRLVRLDELVKRLNPSPEFLPVSASSRPPG